MPPAPGKLILTKTVIALQTQKLATRKILSISSTFSMAVQIVMRTTKVLLMLHTQRPAAQGERRPSSQGVAMKSQKDKRAITMRKEERRRKEQTLPGRQTRTLTQAPSRVSKSLSHL